MGKFKMKGSSLYGKLKLNRNMDDSSRPDGRAKSSTFQADKDEFPGLLPEVPVSGRTNWDTEVEAMTNKSRRIRNMDKINFFELTREEKNKARKDVSEYKKAVRDAEIARKKKKQK